MVVVLALKEILAFNQDPQDDQASIEPQESLDRRAMGIASRLQQQEHTLDKVLGSVRKGVTTHRQLANFCEHHAFVYCVMSQKVHEALEDPD